MATTSSSDATSQFTVLLAYPKGTAEVTVDAETVQQAKNASLEVAEALSDGNFRPDEVQSMVALPTNCVIATPHMMQ